MIQDRTTQIKAKNCKTIEQIDDALAYYRTLSPEVFFRHEHNIKQNVRALMAKRARLQYTYGVKPELSQLAPYAETRQACYFKAIELIPLMLDRDRCAEEHLEDLTILMGCFIGALEAAGEKWQSTDFSDMIQFYNCGSYREKVVYLLHAVVTGGFRNPKEIRNQINLYIKLIRLMGLKSNLGFRVPDYHRESFVQIDMAANLSY